jgi:thioredoxin reductase
MSHEHNMTEHYDYIILGSGITGLFAVLAEGR